MEKENKSFVIFKGKMDERSVYAIIDAKYKNYTNRKSYPWFLSISVPLKNPNQDGLTTSEEAKELNDFEDELLKDIRNITPNCYIGRVTWNGYREILLFVNDPEEISKKLQEIIDSNKYRKFVFKCERDEIWNSVQIYFK